jgi:sortase A
MIDEPGRSSFQDKQRKILLWVHRCLLIAGGILLAYYGLMRGSGWIFSNSAVRHFDQVRAETKLGAPTAIATPSEDSVDFSLWSNQRIRAFTESLKKQEPAIAVLDLNRLNIRVAVFEGTDDWALNRGAGWIEGTARPGETGNTGIAAHRDGFFRALKDVQTGDLIELQMQHKTLVYRVKKTEIIQPEEVRVLLPRSEPTLTLVTCYPFYYVGSAPQRFIVQSTLQETKPIHSKVTQAQPSSVLIHQQSFSPNK